MPNPCRVPTLSNKQTTEKLDFLISIYFKNKGKGVISAEKGTLCESAKILTFKNKKK